MENTNTGGSAFPLPGLHRDTYNNGMTLRDYFAAQTLQGLLASGLDQPKFEFARKSYEMADEMLKARKA